MLIDQRQERILLSLKKLDFLSREQIQKMHKLGKVRNTNRILKDLSPYLSSFRETYSTVYYLSKEGREYVNSEKIRRKNQFVHHVLMRNDFYIYIGQPSEWINEARIRDSQDSIICDAWFKKGLYHILEVDNTQNMKENRAKIEIYLRMFQNGDLANTFGYFPKIVWLTTTELRRKHLKELSKNLPCTVYTIDDIK